MRERLEGKQYVERYLHTLTHELKTPLAAIRGAAELLDEADMPEAERHRFLGNIREQAERLGRVADRLLELARLEQRQVLGEAEAIDLAELVASLMETARPVAAQREVRLELQAEGAPQAGRILATVHSREDQAEIEIHDQGPGIPDYALERVFQRFFSRHTRKAVGRGRGWT